MPEIVGKRSLKAEETAKVVAVAARRPAVQEMQQNIFEQLGSVKMDMDFIVLSNIPFFFFVGRPTLKLLSGDGFQAGSCFYGLLRTTRDIVDDPGVRQITEFWGRNL